MCYRTLHQLLNREDVFRQQEISQSPLFIWVINGLERGIP